METIAYGLFPDRGAADRAVDVLLHTGVRNEGLSIVEHDRDTADQDIQGPGTKSRRDMWIGAALGGLLTAIVVGLVFGDRLEIGLVWTWLASFAAGAVFGGLGGALLGSAAPKSELERLRKRMQRGNVLVTVAAETKRAAQAAAEVLAKYGALHAGPR